MVTFHGAEVLAQFASYPATSVFNVHSTTFFTGDQLCRSHLSQCNYGVLLVVQLRSRASEQQTIGCTHIQNVEKDMYYQADLSLDTQKRYCKQGYLEGQCRTDKRTRT